jgi:hypothetical protein
MHDLFAVLDQIKASPGMYLHQSRLHWLPLNALSLDKSPRIIPASIHSQRSGDIGFAHAASWTLSFR